MPPRRAAQKGTRGGGHSARRRARPVGRRRRAAPTGEDDRASRGRAEGGDERLRRAREQQGFARRSGRARRHDACRRAASLRQQGRPPRRNAEVLRWRRGRGRSGADADRGPAFLQHLVDTVEENTHRRDVVQAYAVLSGESVTDGRPAHDYFQGRFQVLRAKIAGVLGEVSGTPTSGSSATRHPPSSRSWTACRCSGSSSPTRSTCRASSPARSTSSSRGCARRLAHLEIRLSPLCALFA